MLEDFRFVEDSDSSVHILEASCQESSTTSYVTSYYDQSFGRSGLVLSEIVVVVTGFCHFCFYEATKSRKGDVYELIRESLRSVVREGR